MSGHCNSLFKSVSAAALDADLWALSLILASAATLLADSEAMLAVVVSFTEASVVASGAS